MMIDIIMTLLIVGVNGILAKILPEKYDFDKKNRLKNHEIKHIFAAT